MAKCIYIIDDDAAVRTALFTLLTARSAYSVQSYASGDAFLAAISGLEPGVVLLDVAMPGRSGLEVLATIRREALPFLSVVITGNGSIPVAVEAMKQGAIDFLEKPFDALGLLETVGRAFDRLARARDDAARNAAAREQIARLAPREVDVLCGLIAGKVNKVIAHELAISPRTVEVYRAHMMSKLHVHSLPDALRIAFAAGLVQ